MRTRRDFLAFTAGAVVARTVLPAVANASPAVADRDELLLRYNAWLDLERTRLMQEMYPDCDPWHAMRYVPVTRFVSMLADGPAPSTRVLAVLAAAGVYTGPNTVEARRATVTHEPVT